MPAQITTRDLWTDGRNITLTAVKSSPTSLLLTWVLPNNPVAYDGAVVVVSDAPLSPANFPVDGTRYVASTNWTAPMDTIGGSPVVAAFYGFFGDNITQTSVTVTNLDPTKLYYAGIFAASSILQYYTLGSMSYPLAPTPIDAESSTYAGSIPTTAPQNPTNGQAYFDAANNMVLVWNDQIGAWVKSTQATVPTGLRPPIAQYQLFYNDVTNNLEFFNGSAWLSCTTTNTRVKLTPSVWVPFHSATSGVSYPTAPVVGDFLYLTIPAAISAPPTAALKFFTMGSWFNADQNLIQVTIDGVNWVNVVIDDDNLFADSEPAIPAIGDFFYQTATRDLLVWSGSSWVKADVEEKGSPTSDKLGIGDDGNRAARAKLIDILKTQLGSPQVCVEIDEKGKGFEVAIDNALDTFRMLADNAYAHRHVTYTIKGGQTTYYLNDPRDKTDKIVNVLKIHRINQLGISSLSAETGLYAQAFFNQLYQGSNVDVLSIHLMNQLSKSYEKIFAGNLMFTWDEATRELMILRRTLQPAERVVLEVMMERSEQELLSDRWCKQWLQAWAQSELWEQLGEIRSKYGTLPGANGGLTLNGADLLARSQNQQIELKRQINDYEVGNLGAAGNSSVFIG